MGVDIFMYFSNFCFLFFSFDSAKDIHRAGKAGILVYMIWYKDFMIIKLKTTTTTTKKNRCSGFLLQTKSIILKALKNIKKNNNQKQKQKAKREHRNETCKQKKI